MIIKQIIGNQPNSIHLKEYNIIKYMKERVTIPIEFVFYFFYNDIVEDSNGAELVTFDDIYNMCYVYNIKNNKFNKYYISIASVSDEYDISFICELINKKYSICSFLSMPDLFLNLNEILNTLSLKPKKDKSVTNALFKEVQKYEKINSRIIVQ